MNRLLLGFGAVGIWIVLWWWLTRPGGPVPPLYFPSPDAVRLDCNPGYGRICCSVSSLCHQLTVGCVTGRQDLCECCARLRCQPVCNITSCCHTGRSTQYFGGLRIAISNGWMALVWAKLVVGKVGLGFMISQGQENAARADSGDVRYPWGNRDPQPAQPPPLFSLPDSCANRCFGCINNVASRFSYRF